MPLDGERHDNSMTRTLPYRHSDSVSAVAFGVLSPTATSEQTPTIILAVGAYDGMIVLYDGTTGNCLMNISNPEEYKSNFVGPSDVEWLTFHKTGTVLLVGSSIL
jgi:WD40 repeat protein